MTGRVARRADHDHAAVAEDVLVRGLRLNLAALGDPHFEAGGVRATHRGIGCDAVPVALADQQRGAGERRELAGMVGVEVADADELHLLGLYLDLRHVIGDAGLRRVRIGAGREAGVPHHVVVAVLDQVAAERESQLQIRKRQSIREALIQCGHRRRAGATVDAPERYIGLGPRAHADQCAGAECQQA